MEKHKNKSVENILPEDMKMDLDKLVGSLSEENKAKFEEFKKAAIKEAKVSEEDIMSQVAKATGLETDGGKPTIWTKALRKMFGFKLKPFVRESKKTHRNEKCPCGSGNKYKKCCLNKKENNG